ncbi:hypothetical protein V6N12_031198 [Hibiscus sabdariffa]|uniref:RNase H type-1 domain-containing protein n=1 Tax=Hibiscus sabdariffa TaxID=183260 RepID=A0ABR2E889_9ROSI
MVSASGGWDWPRISPLLPPEVLDQIAAIQPPQGWLDSDTPGWRWTVSRQFTTASAYAFIMDTDLSSIDPIWKKIWYLPIPQRVRTFLWLTLHDQNLTNAERAARGLWRRVLQPDFLSDFLHMPFDEWLRNNISRSIDTPLYGPRWEARFAVFYWLLWKDRCSAVLGSDYNPKDDILFRGNRLVDACIQGAANKFQVSHHEQPPTPHWCLPIPGWVKGNVDASVHTSTGQAAIGGLLRDDCGDWVVGFTRPVGRCSVLVAELWTLHDMLHCAWNRGFRKVLIESDCLEVIRILQQTSPSLSSTGLVASILCLTEYDWELVIRHVLRESNALADRLSKWGRIHSPETVILVHPPSTLNALVNAEKGSGLRDPLLVQDWLRDATAACFNLRADPGG